MSHKKHIGQNNDELLKALRPPVLSKASHDRLLSGTVVKQKKEKRKEMVLQ